MSNIKSAPSESNSLQQEVCIDLPGQTVQCWRSADKLKVILRKHRDIIFDLNLGKEKQYAVYATNSDFYSERDKKLIYALRGDRVQFQDGERLHLWVTRSFKGELVLKCGEDILMRISPNKIDKDDYDDAPRTKPKPIIVVLGKPLSEKAVNIQKKKLGEIKTPRPDAAPIDEDCPIVCVVDGSIKDMPANMIKHFAKGGGNTGLVDIDPYDIATRNWIWGQGAAISAYVADNWAWLRESLDKRTHMGFRLVKAKVHMVRGKVRFYFSGYSKYNTVFGPGGFGPGHDRILTIFGGAGKTSSSFTATAKGVMGSFKGFGAVAFVFGIATAIDEWIDDGKKDGYDLTAALITSILKGVVAAALTVLFVSIIVFFTMALFKLTLCVLAVGLFTIVVGLGMNYFVEIADKALGRTISGDDKNTDGVAAPFSSLLRKYGNSIKDSWEDLMKKFPTDYSEILF